MIGLQVAAALLLAAAGWIKLRRPSATRSALTAARLPGARILRPRLVNRGFGLIELAVAVVALLVGGRPAAGLLAASFGLLALVSARMVRLDRGQDCGCFARPTPISHWHTAVNLGLALVGAVGLIRPTESWFTQLGVTPTSHAALLLGAIVLAYLGYLVMTALPDLLTTVADLEAAR